MSALRTELLGEIAGELLHNYSRGRVLFGVDGVDGAGKTTFADELAVALRAQGAVVIRASLDDFHRPRIERYAQGRMSPAGYYADAFDLELFRSILVDPFRTSAPAGFVSAGFDVKNDRPLANDPVTAPDDAILLIDGVFLQRPELRGLWNAVIWLDVDPAERDRRLVARDGIEPGSELDRRYTEAHAIYAKGVRPRESAAIIVDNTDPDSPRRVFTDSC